MPFECEVQESGEPGGLWKARVKSVPEATGYGHSKEDAARAAIDNIIPAMSSVIASLRARLAEWREVGAEIVTWRDSPATKAMGVLSYIHGQRVTEEEARKIDAMWDKLASLLGVGNEKV